MFIAWYWIVLIVLLVGGYFLHLKRYCKALMNPLMIFIKIIKLR